MDHTEFFKELDARIAKYDLLCHPFYKAWADGQLTRDDLREYAQDYYHHVEAFPTYLAELGIRLDDGDLRRATWLTKRAWKTLSESRLRRTPKCGWTSPKAWAPAVT